MDSTKITRLPLRCEPILAESLNGFITRLAERNGLDSAAWVADAAGVRFPQTWYSAADIERLAAVSGLEVETLKAMAPGSPRPKGSATISTVLGQGVPTEALVRHVRRVCPQCLARSPHYRVIWDMRFVRSCVEHGAKLLAACPACGKKLDWRTPSVSGCRCQAAPDLSTVRTAPVPEEQLAGTRFLQAMLLGAEQPVPEFLAGLELDEVFNLLSRFGYLQNGGFRLELDDTVDPGFELSIAHGLAMLSWDALKLERELGLIAWPWRSRLSRRMLPRLKGLHDELKKIGPRAITLAVIVSRVLKDPPAHPAG